MKQNDNGKHRVLTTHQEEPRGLCPDDSISPLVRSYEVGTVIIPPLQWERLTYWLRVSLASDRAGFETRGSTPEPVFLTLPCSYDSSEL